MFAVASSRMTILFFLRIARQIQINCRSPLLKFFPPSVIFKLTPLFSSFVVLAFLYNKSSNPAFYNKSKILSSETYSNGSKLNFSVPVNSVGSYGITVTFFRKIYKSIFEISMPSISIEPSNSSTILLKLIQTVDLPAPVLPTTPTFVPGSTTNVKCFRTAGVFGLYFSVTFLNSTSPLLGQSASTSI